MIRLEFPALVTSVVVLHVFERIPLQTEVVVRDVVRFDLEWCRAALYLDNVDGGFGEAATALVV